MWFVFGKAAAICAVPTQPSHAHIWFTGPLCMGPCGLSIIPDTQRDSDTDLTTDRSYHEIEQLV